MTPEFVECADCGFVLKASDGSPPEPHHWDSCPDCGGATFEAIGD